MFGLFRRRKRPADGSPADEVSAPEVDEAPAPRPPESPDAPLEAWASALGVELDALPPVPDTELEEERIADRVLAHFDQHRPGPASFPSVALQLLELVRDPEVEVAELARVIGMDAALSAGVLVLANSAVYRGVSQIQTVKDAVARLGLNEVARIGAALSTRSLYKPDLQAEFALFGPEWNRLFYHATAVARAASDLSRLRRVADPDRVYLGGMLHDVGKSIALRSVAALALEGEVTTTDGGIVERVLHRVHVEIGAEVHEEWRLPELLVEIAARHHVGPAPGAPGSTELHVVRLCSALDLLRTAPALSRDAFAEVVESAQALGLGPARVAALAVALEETGEWVRMLFGDDRGGPAGAR